MFYVKSKYKINIFDTFYDALIMTRKCLTSAKKLIVAYLQKTHLHGVNKIKNIRLYNTYLKLFINIFIKSTQKKLFMSPVILLKNAFLSSN